MKEIMLPGLGIVTVSDIAAPVLEARGRFVEAYCKDKGWDVKTISMEQILEIRSKEEWKNPNSEQV